MRKPQRTQTEKKNIDLNSLKKDIKREVKREIKREIKNELLEEIRKEVKREKELAITVDDTENVKPASSNEPWVNLVGSGADDEKGIQIELDWNDAFVKDLRSKGVTGSDDDQVVQHWLALLLKDITDEEDEDATSEFE